MEHGPDDRRMIVESDGVRLAVHDAGGGGRDVLLLHGLASTSRIFDLVLPELANGFRAVTYDQRGHGESSKPSSKYGFEYVVADALAVMLALDLDRPIVVGHSWGANVALELGVREPARVSGLVLLDGGFTSMRGRADWKTTKEMLAPPPIAGMHVDQFRSMARRFMPAEMELTPEVEAISMSLMNVDRDGRMRPRLSRANHLRILHSLWPQNATALLQALQVPTLVVGTRRETSDPSELMFIRVKEDAERQIRAMDGPVRFEWIDSIHDVPLQHPGAVANMVRRVAART